MDTQTSKKSEDMQPDCPGIDPCQEVTSVLSDMTLAPDTLFDMLGGMTMQDFIKLDEVNRREIFCQHLSSEEYIEMHQFMDLSKVDAICALLLFKKKFGTSLLGQQLSQEAKQVFYEENHFLVGLNDLDDFLRDILGDWGDAISVKSLVRNLTVMVERHGCKCGHLADFLQHARIFNNLDSISYEWRDCWELNAREQVA